MINRQPPSWKMLGLAGLMVLGVALLITGCNAPPLAGAGGGAAGGGGYPPNTITVIGTGEASGSPDVAYLQLGVDITNSDIGRAVEQSNQTIRAITEALIAQGIEAKDMQTSGFNVWQEDVYDPQTGLPTGEKRFHVNVTLSVVVRSIDKLSQVIQAGLAAGANNIYGLSFGIDDTTALEDQARTDAIADAQARAEKLASALGVKLGAPTIISEYSGGGAYPQYGFGVGGGGGGAAGAPPISEGQLTVTMTVNVTYAITP